MGAFRRWLEERGEYRDMKRAARFLKLALQLDAYTFALDFVDSPDKARAFAKSLVKASKVSPEDVAAALRKEGW